jgi:hypothetical protein
VGNSYEQLVEETEGYRPLWCEDMSFIQVAENRIQWRALVNMGMNLRIT